LGGKGFKLSWSNPQETFFEAFLSRGDRRLGPVIESAWRSGARFDAWHEYFNYSRWQEAFEENGLDISFYSHRARSEDEIFPWDVIDTGPSKKVLWREYQNGLEGITRPDCSESCFACGVTTKFFTIRPDDKEDTWKCPPLASSRARTGAANP